MQLTIKHFCSIHQTELTAKESRDSKGTNIFVETCKDCLESVAKKNCWDSNSNPVLDAQRMITTIRDNPSFHNSRNCYKGK